MNYKNVIFGVAGFGLGVFAGIMACKKRFESQYRAEIEDNRQFYIEKLEELGVMPDGYEAEIAEAKEESDGDEEDADAEASESEGEDDVYDMETERVVNDYRGTPRINYSKPSLDEVRRALAAGVKNVPGASLVQNESESLGEIDGSDAQDEDEPETDEELEAQADEFARRRSENMKRGEPYVIEPEEYLDGPDEYDRQALYYYAQDRTLCEDDDQVVEDEEACVGLDYEDVLDTQTTCWVRNDTLRVLYEIHRIEDSYTKAVLNARETPREREFRLQSRRKQALDEQ